MTDLANDARRRGFSVNASLTKACRKVAPISTTA